MNHIFTGAYANIFEVDRHNLGNVCGVMSEEVQISILLGRRCIHLC